YLTVEWPLEIACIDKPLGDSSPFTLILLEPPAVYPRLPLVAHRGTPERSCATLTSNSCMSERYFTLSPGWTGWIWMIPRESMAPPARPWMPTTGLPSPPSNTSRPTPPTPIHSLQ